MTARYTDIALAMLMAWVAWGVMSLFTGPIVALVCGGGIAALVVRFLRHTLPMRGIVAVLDPIAVVIPLLILRQVAGALGLPLDPFGALEMFVFLVLYVAFLACAFGVIPADPYRFGYKPLPVAALVLGLCAYGWATGNLFIPFLAVIGQGLWVFKIGSSNYFDHILHVLLVPIVIVVLISRVFG